jgi:hypothetical protein
MPSVWSLQYQTAAVACRPRPGKTLRGHRRRRADDCSDQRLGNGHSQIVLTRPAGLGSDRDQVLGGRAHRRLNRSAVGVGAEPFGRSASASGSGHHARIQVSFRDLQDVLPAR